VLAAGKRFVEHVVPAVIKPLRVLWNEMIAFVFLALGVLTGFSTYRNYTGEGQASGSPVILVMGGGFALLLVYFGLSSWRRAKKISRS
jgi:hypothetical protein